MQNRCRALCKSGARGADRLCPQTVQTIVNEEVLPRIAVNDYALFGSLGDLDLQEESSTGLKFYQDPEKKAEPRLLPLGIATQGRKKKVRLETQMLEDSELVEPEATTPMDMPFMTVAEAGSGRSDVPESLRELLVAAKRGISLTTGKRYLGLLHFEKRTYVKGGYFDNHERKDVVEDRIAYLREKKEDDLVSLRRMPTEAEIAHYMTLPLEQRPLIEFVHDESTFNANDTVSTQWIEVGADGKLRSKSAGAGIMGSAFICEVLGNLSLEVHLFIFVFVRRHCQCDN
jgi:hypothetical protein